MYATYVTKVGATAADILSDLVSLFTGTTNPTALSASADYTTYSGITWLNGVGSGFSGLTDSALIGQNVYASGANVGTVIANTTTTVTLNTSYTNAVANTACIAYTSIFADYEAAGWSMWHSISSTIAVLKAAYMTENGVGYKYLKINTGTTNVINFVAYERWYNASGVDALGNSGSSYTGLNACPSTSGISLSGVSLSTAKSYFYIHANQSHIHIAQASSYKGVPIKAFSLFEYTRSSPWDTNANGYPPVVTCDTFPNNAPVIMRSINYNGADTFNANGEFVFGGMYLNSPPFGIAIPNAAKIPQHALVHTSCQLRNNGFFPVDLSSFSNIFVTTLGLGSNFDELLYNDGSTTKRFVLWSNGTNPTWRIAVLKG